jgi:hypothetical protein
LFALVQQGWFRAPQVPQPPVAPQVPAPAHDWPFDTQTESPLPIRVQQPEVQRLPRQQGPPATPHFLQMGSPCVLFAHADSGSVQVGCPEPQQAVPIFPQVH